MTERTRNRLAAAALVVGLAVLYVIILLSAVHSVGTDAELYYREQMKAGILPASGLSDGELWALDHRLAAYLKGDAPALEADPPFNDREMTHMRDCFELFEGLRHVRGRLVPWAIVLALGGAWVLRDRRRIRRCAYLSPLLLIVPLGAFALFAALNFDAAFTLFHRLLFRNDLWLLNPATDLLIRICPESMFMAMGVRILIVSLLAVAAVVAVIVLLTRLWPKGKEENSWKTTTRRGPAPRQYDFGKRGAR